MIIEPLSKKPPPAIKPPPKIDYATPSIYQTNAPYKGVVSPRLPGSDAPGNMHPLNQPTTPPAPITPSTSTFAPAAQSVAPVQPITANPTGQFSLASTANPFNTPQAIQQPPTTTGKAGKVKPAPKPKPKAKPKASKPTALDRYLGKDSDYQNTIRNLNRALADFKARKGIERTRAGTTYGYSKKTMEDQKTHDLSDIQNDAASRGIATSGVYGTRVGDYNTTYNSQLGELGRQYKNQLTDFASALRDFNTQQNLQKETARSAALRRRAAKLGKVS